MNCYMVLMMATPSLLLWPSQRDSRQNCKGEEYVYTWCLRHREDGAKAVRKGIQ